MEITDIPTEGYERVVRAKDTESGLHAIISVHDTTLGPALGGLRMWNYESEDEALFDVLRLSRGPFWPNACCQRVHRSGQESAVLRVSLQRLLGREPMLPRIQANLVQSHVIVVDAALQNPSRVAAFGPI